jgi:acetyl-CoA/propionyl-CoA carboxylase biotin carboxyl carrier protein
MKAAPRSAHKKRAVAASGNDVTSPMHGVVVELSVAQGDSVEQGQVVAVIEAMKMMNELRAHKTGTVAAIRVAVGATVEARTPLVTIEG